MRQGNYPLRPLERLKGQEMAFTAKLQSVNWVSLFTVGQRSLSSAFLGIRLARKQLAQGLLIVNGRSKNNG